MVSQTYFAAVYLSRPCGVHARMTQTNAVQSVEMLVPTIVTYPYVLLYEYYFEPVKPRATQLLILILLIINTNGQHLHFSLLS